MTRPDRSWGRGLRLVVCWCALAVVFTGCTFLNNEFFVFDKAAPPAEEPSGADARW